MKKVEMILICSLLSLATAFGHGDHAVPGSLPPAPHGGVLERASHKHAQKMHTKHGHKERNIYFEGRIDGNMIKIYPIELNHSGHGSFSPVKLSEVKEFDMDAIEPRKKIKVLSEIFLGSDYWGLNIDGVKGRRFIISAKGKVNGELFKVKIQVERK